MSLPNVLSMFSLSIYALHCVMVQVLTLFTLRSHGKNLIFGSILVHFSPRSFEELPLGFFGVKIGYLAELECTISNRYIRPVKCTPLTGRKVHCQ